MAKAKNPTRSETPFGESSRCQKIVAKIAPVTRTAPKRIPKSSGILREFVRDRFPITAISIQNGFAKAGTETAAVELLPLLLAPDTSFPLEMLALMASFRDGLGLGSFCAWPEFFSFSCHDLLKSTKLLVPPGCSSSSRIRSSANSVRFSFSGMGWPNSEKKDGRFAGEPL